MHQNSDYKIYFPQIVSNTLEPKGNQQSYCKLHTRYSTFVLLPDTQRMTFRLNKLLEIPIYTFLVSVDTFLKKDVCSFVTVLLVTMDHISPTAGYSCGGGWLQKRGGGWRGHACTHFCKVKWHYIKSSISICGLLLLLWVRQCGQGNSPKDRLYSSA